MSTHANMVQMTVTSVASAGVGTITLNAASSGYQSLGTAYGGNATVDILITEGTAWEVARNCTYTHSGTTVTRGTLEASSTGSAVAFTSAAVVSVVATAASGTRWDQNSVERVAGTDADVTMVLGSNYMVDMSAWATADRNYTLPAATGSGRRIRVQILGGNASYELVLKTDAAGVCKFAGSSVASATEITRLSITGETITFLDDAANVWKCEQDGRIGDMISELADGTVVADTDELIVLRAGDNFRAKLYSEGTFTPGITFGGAAVGLTLSGATGLYLRIGEWCFFNLSVSLSAKGSSTGNMAITGLPFTPDSAVPAAGIAVRASALASTVGGIFGQWVGGATTLAVAQSATGTAATLTDANCTNGSSFNISGFYKVA